MNLKGIHHVAIICSNYEKSKAFYVNVLGGTIIRETYRKERKSYKLDILIGEKDIIELFSFPNPPYRPTNPEACGLRHLAFRVDRVEETVDYLHQKEIEVEPIRLDTLTGKKFTFFRAPDNLPIEIYEE
jgi:glyoxylase I family protein